MNHYHSIKCLKSRIEVLSKERLLVEKTIETTQMQADLHFAEVDLKNINDEITEIQSTISSLIKK